MAKVNVKAVCKEFDNLWDRITQIPLWEVFWEFTGDDDDVPTDGPCVSEYDTTDCDYEEALINVLKADGRIINEPTDTFIVTVLANNREEAVKKATEAYEEFYEL